ncbi:flagellar protein FliO/FliZ [Arthrobacter sp. V4I6]|uniref:flagellar biosynthetic protein FliO n=1 Tax=unclassified Arthrobacter TaxID=235627 RepID=UPI00278987CE|nr:MULTISPECIES: flagellar biosynthetic protein FliO [unclassified Arthrobacter]MDQ0822671.1 flagellar protein FliO/FliZ [Arthrobacter sp. V1I7]MDQ0852299.1 flagellar protein FliO/FliZ [Arthrobacter sp. V4I6]
MDTLILGLRVLVALGAVLGLMWFLQRRLGQGTGRRRADRALTIVSRQSVGQKASVVVVDAAGQRFLLGVTEHAVNVLHTGDIPAEADEPAAPETQRRSADFARILSGIGPVSNGPDLGRDGRAEGSPAAGPAGAPAAALASDGGEARARSGESDDTVPLSRRSTLHRDSHGRGPASRAAASGHPPMHGSILAGSTWKQAAAALRSGRRN